MGAISETIDIVEKLMSLKKSDPHSELSLFVFDAKRFIFRNKYMADTAPLQLYCSGLIFSPKKSIASELFEETRLEKLHILPRVEQFWGADFQTLEGRSSPFGIDSVAFSPDGQIIASGSSDMTVRLWDAKTGQELQTLQSHSYFVQSVAFSPDGQIIASGSADNTIKLWGTKTGQELQTFLHFDPVKSVAFSPDGQIIASGLVINIIKLWDIKNQELQIPALRSSSHWIISITFYSDGQIVASGSSDGTIKLWDTKTSKELQILQGHSESVSSVAFSPDGQIIVSGSYDRTIKFWDSGTGQELHTIQGHSDRVDSVASSPDNQTIASADDLAIKLWDAKTGQELQTIQNHSRWFYSIAFSPNGQILPSRSSDWTTKLWDIKTGEELHTLHECSYKNRSLAFSPDGKILRTSHRSPRFETTYFWDVETGKRLQAPVVEADSVASISDQSLSELDLLVHNVSIADGWVAFRNENLLWLPAEYRHAQIACSAIQGDNLALGYCDGRVVILGFRNV
ncbi:hypothetical protein N7493_009609 [Penicillium malachiteum]|uniref:Mitochondrial division protein 1 n=1 Tax=Penicillium malachiteum TaxID=1324776 RepID=A0AAD6MSF2_9EURO|nr:hypothetical protein N7493_009609 [Penicillium malachiteum]